ncbi:eukaryotic translation initiation factor 2D-like isoform X1 [Hydractinia symbiolongicarpus]|uniref:eukaryotic translation initiation factor 2D-like isoform X1 n=1 Tax=Hydractinia symbiolongicarpus TaxID=13093 RepID=UPI00255013E1|nr:eukaryotic translation initiation factor 2D-like isoform X1 [Hydractinia symbiolongicarpus]
MFRKPFKVRSNTTIRGSERRKLRENVAKAFPHLSSNELSELVPSKDEMTVMKIYTYTEKNITCYCLQKNPIFFETEGFLLPTVYLLWEHRNCLKLSLKTFPHVFSKLSGGADLMFPGVIFSKAEIPNFNCNSVCFITLQGNSSAVAVGVTTCSSQDILNDGPQGKRVTIYHCLNDQLWAIGNKTDLPVIPDVSVEGHSVSMENQTEIPAEIPDTIIEQDACDDSKIQSSVALCNDDYTCDSPIEEQSENVTLTPQEEMDNLIENCFCQAVLDAKKVELPILVSTFSSQYLHAACPDGKRIEVKKSSYKKMSKFLSEMQSRGMIKVQELSKGVESITAITLENEMLRCYKSSDFAHVMKETKELKLVEEQEATRSNKSIEIRELYGVSAKTNPFFKLVGLNKGNALSSSEVRKFITEYVKEKELMNLRNKKKVNLDALLTDVLFGKKDYEESLTWDQLLTRMLDNMNMCHEVTLPGKKPIIKKGKMEMIEVSVEQRMGNKKVTIVKNLESFGVDVKAFAQDLQQAAASSTSVNLSPGKNSNTHFVLVQGIQTKHIKNLLETYKIPKKYLKGLDVKEKRK